MIGSKENGKTLLLIAIIGIAAGIAFVGGFAFSKNHYDLVGTFFKRTSTKEKVVPAAYTGDKKTLGYDEYNIVYDENEYTYSYVFDSYAGLNDSYIEIKYGGEKNTINLVRNYLESEKVENHTLEFDSKVVDSFVAGFGEDNYKDSIFFILEDGSIEYILISRAIKNDDYRTFKIYHLKNVVKYYNANACSEVTNVCSRTVLVQSMDGTIYNLVKYVQ